MPMSRSKLRDARYGIQPKNVPLTSESLPATPAKKPSAGYCKRLKGEHVMELAEVKVYKHHSYPYGYPGPLMVSGVTNRKEYRCTGCGKKKMEREVFEFDAPVEARRLA